MPDFRPYLPRLERFRVTTGVDEIEAEGSGIAIAWLGFVVEFQFARVTRIIGATPR